MAPPTTTSILKTWTLDFVKAVNMSDGPALATLIRDRCDKLQLKSPIDIDEVKDLA